MIVIEKPELQELEGKTKISCKFSVNGGVRELWYLYDSQFSKYLVTERSDAFLVALLFLGLKTGNDIIVKGSLSARLFYAVNHYLINALCLANPRFTRIKLIAPNLSHENLNKAGVAGTGMSCGVDSFATYYDHFQEKGPYEIKYFTFFNVGSHLDFGGDKARLIYQRRLNSVEEFAQKEGKGVIPVDSNLSEILEMNFQQTHSLRSISCVLHLQKLISIYYYSSAYRFDHFKLNAEDTSDSDFLILQLLNTESTTFYASVAQYSRVERTMMVATHSGTWNFLDVCTAPPDNLTFLNCSNCYKCLRTQLTLDIIGKLKYYDTVFNFEVYRREKDKYIGKLLGKRNKTVLDLEVLNFIQKKNFPVSWKSYYYAFDFLKNYYKKSFKKKVKLVLGL